MVKCENGNLSFRGEQAVIYADIGCILTTALKEHYITEKELDTLVSSSKDLSKKSDKELSHIVLSELTKHIKALLDELEED